MGEDSEVDEVEVERWQEALGVRESKRGRKGRRKRVGRVVRRRMGGRREGRIRRVEERVLVWRELKVS